MGPWQLTIMGVGVLLLIGAIFNINFLIDRQGEPSMGFLSLFGDRGYRIIVGMIVFGTISLF